MRERIETIFDGVNTDMLYLWDLRSWNQTLFVCAVGWGKIDPEAITDILDPEGEKKVCESVDTKVGYLDCLI